MAQVKSALPDGTIKANFKSENYTAKLSTVVSCVNNSPAGNFSMFATGTEVWRITSNTVRDVDTEKNPLSDHVHAVYGNTVVKNETTGKKYTNCIAFLDACEWPVGGGRIGLNITLVVYHNSRSKPVFEWDGIFFGELNVNREVSCGD